MNEFLSFFENNAVSITIIISIISLSGGLFKFWQYIDVRKKELKQKRFENYHLLIKRLAAPQEQGEWYLDI